MKVTVHEAAAGDLDDILVGFLRTIRAQLEGTRELIEAPYVIAYEVDEPAEEILVLAIVHGARDREV
jgi:plasmid stabilization system protein ParE